MDDGVHGTPDYKGIIDGIRWVGRRQGTKAEWGLAVLSFSGESLRDAPVVVFDGGGYRPRSTVRRSVLPTHSTRFVWISVSGCGELDLRYVLIVCGERTPPRFGDNTLEIRACHILSFRRRCGRVKLSFTHPYGESKGNKHTNRGTTRGK